MLTVQLCRIESERRVIRMSRWSDTNDCVSVMAKRVVDVAKSMDPSLFPLLLYKRILRLHYGLPGPARLMGDTYVKDEFRAHKNVPQEQAMIFLNEWTQYCVMLSKQLSGRGLTRGRLGKDFEESDLEKFTEDQLGQLLELKEEAEKEKSKLKCES